MVTPFIFDEDFRKNIFADDPNLAFQTSLTGSGLSRRMSDFFRQRTSSFLNRFQGALGQQLDEFGTVDLNPLDFFQGLNFRDEFLRFSPRERGENTRLFNPKTRRLFY